MIFTSLAFLVVALVLLIVGIIKGSLGFSVAALIVSIVAGLLLLVANALYRQLMAPRDEEAIDVTPAPMTAPATDSGAAVYAAAVAGRVGPPVDGYADLTAQAAAKLAETLNLEELHTMRRYEVEHANRKSVLAAVDKRVDAIIAVRRQLQGDAVTS